MDLKLDFLGKKTIITLTANEREAIRTVSNLFDQILCTTQSISDFQVVCNKRFLFDKDGLIDLCRDFDYMRANEMILKKIDE